MTALRAWFTGRSLREQRMILVMLALAALTFVWLVVIRPVGDGLSSSRERFDDAVLRLADTRARVAAVDRARRGGGAAPAGPIADAVRASADRAGFMLTGVAPAGPDGVQVTLGSAKGGALMRWLSEAERSGLIVDQLSVTDNGDRTVAAQVTLRARGA